MLCIIFHNLKPVSLALTFEVDVREELDVRRPARFCSNFSQLWKRTSHTFIAAMSAVAQSGLILIALHVYGGRRSGALSLYDLHHALPRLKIEGIATALASLQKLYICVAPYVPEDNTEEENAPQDNTEGGSPNNEYYMALAEIISLTPNIEELDVHGFKVRGQRDIYLDSIIQKALHKLKKCALRGAYIEEDSLLQLLRNNLQLESLYLKHIVLSGGSWKNIFNYLALTSSSDSAATHETDSCSTTSCELDVVILDSLSASPPGRYLRFLQRDGKKPPIYAPQWRIEIHGTAHLRYEIQYDVPSEQWSKESSESIVEFGPLAYAPSDDIFGV
ncbi:hypothetical protein BDQ12DRAFT_726008 [Crucibulum laeve]|uniref:Uncharacterized protein n=1 Tax=Crucibulum laeve TaxID=68775 RepID=A0A5C3LSB5_9AGAR|nr:hypothetical protein BDQ12DRAFT_726008 [Crucibulum laeve]